MNGSETIEMIRGNGVDLALHRFGHAPGPQDEARTILLLHGFLDAAATWDLVAAPLVKAGFEVLALDFRGFGHSERVPEGGYYYFPDYVADLDAVVETLDRPFLSLVSHSMGGGVAALYAACRPERVKRLVIMEGLGPVHDPPELSVNRMRKWLGDLGRIDRRGRRLASIDEAVERLAASHPRIDRETLASRAERLVRRDDDGSIAWAWDPLHRSVSPIPFSAAVFGSFLDAISCPTLFIGGGPLGWHPPDEEERLARIKDLTRVDFEGAGHMMHWTRPGPVAAALTAFISGEPPASANTTVAEA